MKQGLAVILMCVLSLAVTVPSQTAAHLDGVVSESELTTYELVSDSTFEVEPAVIYGENRTCFSHWYQPDFQGTDQNVVCINWTHQAGVQYNHSYSYPATEPRCTDYVALRIPLFYPYNATPVGLKGSFETRILSTGDFVQYFFADILVYLVTEAGYWHTMEFTRSDVGLETFSSSPFGASRSFFQYELQETVAGGDVPTSGLGSAFEIVLYVAPIEYFTYSGWDTMSGTVAIEVSGFSAEVLLHNSTAVEILEPSGGEPFNTTQAYPRGSVAVDDSGASYCLFESLGGWLMVKWEKDLTLAYNRVLDFPEAQFDGILYHEGQVYCYGSIAPSASERYAFLVCTDLEASVVWFREYHIGESSHVLATEMDGDESIFVTGSAYSESSYFAWIMVILPDGRPLWNTTFRTQAFEFYRIHGIHGNRFYSLSQRDGCPICYSLQGELLWRGSVACDGLTVGPGGHIYTWVQNHSYWGGSWAEYLFFRYDSDGTVLWNRTLQIAYPGGWIDVLYMMDVDIRLDGRLSATFVLWRYLERAIMYSVSADGESELAGTLSDSTPYGSSFYEMPYSIRSLNGFFLVLLATYSVSGTAYTLLSYEGPALDTSGSGLLIMLGTAGAAALLAGWILYDRVGSQKLVDRLRRRKENSGGL